MREIEGAMSGIAQTIAGILGKMRGIAGETSGIEEARTMSMPTKGSVITVPDWAAARGRVVRIGPAEVATGDVNSGRD